RAGTITSRQARSGLEGQRRIQHLGILDRTTDLACPNCLAERWLRVAASQEDPSTDPAAGGFHVMRARLHLAGKVVRGCKRLVPAALPVTMEHMLRLLPADEPGDPQPGGRGAAAFLQLARSTKIAEQNSHPREIRQ